MGGNYHDGKYALFVSLYVRFQGDQNEPNKKCPVDKYTKKSIGTAMFVWQVGSIKKIICESVNNKISRIFQLWTTHKLSIVLN